MAEDFAKLRQEMVARQLFARGVRHQGVLAAMADVPREMFVPPDRVAEAYEDRPLPIGLGQTISQPYIVALMIQELDPHPGQRVLDVGAGSGYQTAILARLTGHVFAMERHEQLTERAMAALGAMNIRNVTICTGDGSVGWPEEAPFDRIICGAGAPDTPQAWIDQLADGGRIVVPTGEQDCQTLVRIDKAGGRVTRREVCGVRFVKLVGREGWPS
jgi:protein-L-isoaspartate(D-aspartate) O-methyltransferase